MNSKGKGFWKFLIFAVLIAGTTWLYLYYWIDQWPPFSFGGHGPHPDRVWAVNNLDRLTFSLEAYKNEHHSYPDNWLEDMYPKQGIPFGDLGADLDIQSEAKKVALGGYSLHKFRYTPLPMGCQEPNCTRYILTAVPLDELRNEEEIRSYFTDESGVIHHCVGRTGADITDRALPVPWKFRNRRPRPCKAHPQ